MEQIRNLALARGLVRTCQKSTNGETCMSFSAISNMVWARKFTFVMVFALIVASTMAFTLLVTPMFQSEAITGIRPLTGRSDSKHSCQTCFGTS